MKATRRQELKTNELARMLEDAREFLRVRGNYLVGGLVVVAIAALGYVYMNRSAAQALADANRQVDTLPFGTDAEVKDSIEKLKALAAEHDDNEAFVMNTLRRRAAFAMRRAHVAEDGTLSKEFLDVAAEAYHAIVDRFGHRSLDVAAAHCGLATIEEDLFILDNDPAHKEAAPAFVKARSGPPDGGRAFGCQRRLRAAGHVAVL